MISRTFVQVQPKRPWPAGSSAQTDPPERAWRRRSCLSQGGGAQGVVWAVLVCAVLVLPPDPGNASLTVVVVVLAWDPSSEPTNAPTPAATNTNTIARATAFQVIDPTLPYKADRCCVRRLRYRADED